MSATADATLTRTTTGTVRLRLAPHGDALRNYELLITLTPLADKPGAYLARIDPEPSMLALAEGVLSGSLKKMGSG